MALPRSPWFDCPSYKHMAVPKLPTFAKIWFLLTVIICTWDASFVLLRPYSLPGGKWHQIWKPYALYITMDRRYGDVNDAWVATQSYLNLFENIVYLMALFSSGATAFVLGFSCSLLTAWKTVIYFGIEIVSGYQYTGHCTPAQFWTGFIFPSSIWIVAPVIMCGVLLKSWAAQSRRPAESKKADAPAADPKVAHTAAEPARRRSQHVVEA
ncbi:putative emopamil-binding protein [Paratrimastix pyriformis]|uniref:Emopamil-binding protein n=1 Tax=Paratrimastix pyriformis TaxID=342808 RepID=A0ABQ8UDK0_9EUKA|nr:putative emopamil-binding protein [Paratrimastix pyriformis]